MESPSSSRLIFFSSIPLAFAFYLLGSNASVPGENPLGLGFTFRILLMLASLSIIAAYQKSDLISKNHWIIGAIALFALFIAWRDSSTLTALNVLCIIALCSLMMFYKNPEELKTAGTVGYGIAFLYAPFSLFWSFPTLLLQKPFWKDLASIDAGFLKKCFSVLAGIFIASPFLLLFGFLLASADDQFANLLGHFFYRIFSNGSAFFWVFVWMWILGGFLNQVVLKDKTPYVSKESSATLFGIIEIGVVLGLINLLFATFIISQLPYFFADAGSVDLAQAAKKGFFQLVAVSALTLPLLLLSHWLLDKRNLLHEKIFKALAISLIILLYVIMGLAAWRMFLYQAKYGFTELRFYTSAFMLWLAGVFLYFILTVLHDRGRYFNFGALISAFVMIAILNIANPDGWIARVNLARSMENRSLDIYYFSHLSNDALPAVFEWIDGIPQQDACRLLKIYENRILSTDDRQSWKDWNWSRRYLEKSANDLADLGCR